jgi:hypothetical protein
MTVGAIDAARLTRGHVPEWGDDYIERQVPASLLEKMNGISHWIDDDGFWWGYRYMYATKIKATNEPVVVVAQKPLGDCCALCKVVVNDNFETYFSELLY